MSYDDPPGEPIPLSEGAAHIDHLMAVGQLKRARQLATQLVASDPDDAAAQIVLSRVLIACDQPEVGLRAAERAVQLAPDDDRAHEATAFANLVLGRFSAAERAILEALSLDPLDETYHLFYARLLHACGRREQALQAVRRAMELDPDEPDAHELHALLMLSVRPSERQLSEESARRALRLDPEDPDAHAAIGWVHVFAGRHDQAEESFREALRLDPEHQAAFDGLAESVMAQRWYYRPMLRLSTWLARSGPSYQLFLIFGLWAVVSAVRAAFGGTPDRAWLSDGITVLYVALCAYTWFAAPVTRWLLARRYPWLRERGP